MKSRRRVIFQEFLGEICRCGRPKDSRKTFCRTCYFSLPVKLRKALYQLFGEGYERAYEESVAYLIREELDRAEQANRGPVRRIPPP